MRQFRDVINALLPPGPLWEVQDGSDFDALLDGISACLDTVTEDARSLAYVRDPLLTPVLSDLEREYGVVPRYGSSEADRRAYLAALRAIRSSNGPWDALQDTLQTAGFNVQVHVNDPPVDPGFFVYYRPSAIFGNNAALFGASSFGATRGEVLVNGATYLDQAKVQYEIPTESGYWPCFFFIAGDATRNEIGELTDMQDAEVPAERKGEFISLILRCKPLRSWAGLRIKYI